MLVFMTFSIDSNSESYIQDMMYLFEVEQKMQRACMRSFFYTGKKARRRSS